MSRAGRAVDHLVSIFSPQAALRRTFWREAYAKRSRYAAASSPRTIGGWSPVDSPVNTLLGNSLAPVRSRVRQLVRDFPILARAVEIGTTYTVGDGIRFQSRVKDPSGKLDKKRIQLIEDEFAFWMDEADIAGRLHYYEIMALAKRQDLETGEFLIVKKLVSEPGRRLPFVLQVYEGDWLSDLAAKPANPSHLVKQGIEYDPATGRVVAFHLADPEGFGKSERVPAENVIHGFKTLRPGQLRGISPYAPGVLLAKDLQDLMDAELDASKMAAKYLALVKTLDPTFRQTAVGAVTDPTSGRKIEELENAVIEYLRPGEDVVLASNPRPGANFPPFIKLIMTLFAVVAEIPYELISGNYEGLNYSTGRMVRNDFAQQLRPVAGRHVRHFCMKTFRPFMDVAALSGRLSLPAYSTNPAAFLACEWQPPGMESIDPLRESKARIDEIKSGLRSPQEHVQARGRDLEDVYNEIAQAKAMAEELGLNLDIEGVSTAVANNPAAVTDDQGKALSSLLLQHLTEAAQ